MKNIFLGLAGIIVVTVAVVSCLSDKKEIMGEWHITEYNVITEVSGQRSEVNKTIHKGEQICNFLPDSTSTYYFMDTETQELLAQRYRYSFNGDELRMTPIVRALDASDSLDKEETKVYELTRIGNTMYLKSVDRAATNPTRIKYTMVKKIN